MFLYQSPQSTKISRRNAGSTNNARTEEVLEHLTAAPIPANPKALSRLQTLIKNLKGDDDPDRLEIMKEIVADPGLALHYLSKVRQTLSLESLPDNPLECIRKMQVSQLNELFQIEAEQISSHKIEDATPPQLLRMQHTFIAACCASNLSEQLELNSGKTFSLVQLSNSALNLLAWNYPEQFHKALFNQRKYKASLDDSLNSLIGVRPSNLVTKLAKKVGVSSDTMLDLQLLQKPTTVESRNLPNSPNPVSVTRLGDLLAKANDIEHYPEALAQWEKVEQNLEERGITSPRHDLYQAVKQFVSELNAESKLPYRSALFPVKTQHFKEPLHIERDLSKLNPLLKKVPEKYRLIFEKAYKLHKPGELSVGALHVLVGELATELQVICGVIYLAKGDKQVLHAALQFGASKKAKKILDASLTDPYYQSQFATFPQQFESGPGLVTICGALPECLKQAVLALEFDVRTYQFLGDKLYSIYQAYALAMCDILGQRHFR